MVLLIKYQKNQILIKKSNAHQGGPATVGVTIVSDVDIWYDAGDGATLQNDSNSFTASSTYVGNVVPSFEGSFCLL